MPSTDCVGVTSSQHVGQIGLRGKHRRKVNRQDRLIFFDFERYIVHKYLPVDLPPAVPVLLLSSILLVCEAFRFPGDKPPDVTNNYDVADNRIDDNVPDEVKMVTKIDVRDTEHLRGKS